MPHISKPKENLSILDSVAIVVGIVIGIGIFKTPSIVASVAESSTMVLMFWFLGGFISLIGALCYAELTSTYPHAGGDYYFLKKAFGSFWAFLFAWSRMAIIQSGSIAMIAFLIGDYATEVFSLGNNSNVIYAIATISLLTSINIIGIKQGKVTQHTLILLIMLGLITVISFGIFSTNTLGSLTIGKIIPTKAALGTAMIFVLLTYGGWNEAAFISSEVRSKHKNMIKILLISITIITITYLLVNIALIKALGLTAMAESKTIVADLMKVSIGVGGSTFITVLILIAALSTINATIITGARSNYALGKDYPILSFLGHWKEKRNTPMNALLVQGAIALVLILFGAGSRDGFIKMVEYTAPVFWFFLFMVGISLFILRYKYPQKERAFSVPLYPATPVLFCMFCLYMLYSSIVYTSSGSIVGIIVLLTGIPVLLFQRKKNNVNLKLKTN